MKDQIGNNLRIGQNVLVLARRTWYLGSVHAIDHEDDPIRRLNVVGDDDQIERSVIPECVIGLDSLPFSIENVIKQLIMEEKLFTTQFSLLKCNDKTEK